MIRSPAIPASTRTWIGARALLAVALMIGFYLLALAVAGGLFWIPYAEYAYWSRVHGQLALFCLFAGGTVLWSIAPRIDRFQPPGPGMKREQQPRLFELIEEVARLTSQAIPSEVYLVPQLNAWVAQRGGVMGFGSRRVMGIGLPLLHTLTLDELRAVLAHEFGHYYSGDTRLGPWVYKTRAAIARTIRALESDQSIVFVLVQAPFKAYGTFFLRISQAVSRAQEYAADALAARVIGARHLGSGLKSIHAAAPMHEAFWQGEYAPLLGSGLVPPFGEGFRSFLASEEVREALASALAAHFEKAASDPFDTHPPLKLRLQAIGEAAEASMQPPESTAAAVLERAEDLELQLLSFSFGEQAVSRLRRIAWEDVGARFFRPLMERTAAAAAPALQGLTPESLPEIAHQFHVRNDRLLRSQPGESYFREQGAEAIRFVGAALTLAALQAGGEIVSRPCRPLLVRIAGGEVDFFSEFKRLRSGSLEVDRWSRIVAAAGITGVDLGRLQSERPDS